MKYKTKIQVVCNGCKEWFDEEKVKFFDISEDPQGKDLLTFECPKCGKVSKSYRLG